MNTLRLKCFVLSCAVMFALFSSLAFPQLNIRQLIVLYHVFVTYDFICLLLFNPRSVAINCAITFPGYIHLCVLFSVSQTIVN